MKITIVNGTNRIENKTLEISRTIQKVLKEVNINSHLISLDNFTELFRGEYLNLKNSKGKAKFDIENFNNSDLVIFVSPNYHHALPESLKNFFDLLSEELYNNKVFAFIASGNQEYSARQAYSIVDAIISYRKHNSITLSRIEVIDYDNIDIERIKRFLNYCLTFKVLKSR